MKCALNQYRWHRKERRQKTVTSVCAGREPCLVSLPLGSINVISAPQLLLHQAEHHWTFRMLKQNCLCLLLPKMEQNGIENQHWHRQQRTPSLCQPCQSSRSIWRTFLGTGWDSWADLCRARTLILVGLFQLRIFYNQQECREDNI